MTERVLVTGGGGFVAGWCIIELLKRDYRVRATLRSLDAANTLRAAIARHVDPGDRLEFIAADLTDDTGWSAAMAGVDRVLHVASPLGNGTALDRDANVAPARDGTLRVLRAAVAAGVKRVVMTSAAATARRREGTVSVNNETIWADPDAPGLDPYRRSKIIAERAAWDFMTAEGGAAEFTTILPGAVFGPVLDPAKPGSARLIKGLLEGNPRGLLDIGLAVVDVRDLAALHVTAMTAPAAVGERFLATGTFVKMIEIAHILRAGLGDAAAKVPMRVLPNLLVRALAWFNPRIRMFVADLGGAVPAPPTRHGGCSASSRALRRKPSSIAHEAWLADCSGGAGVLIRRHASPFAFHDAVLRSAAR